MQLLNLQVPLHLVAAVKGVGDVGDQLPVFGLGGEIAATALDQLLLQPVLPVPVGPSIAPFSWATPRLLRVAITPKWAQSSR